MAYINSKDIKMFPSAYRDPTDDPTSRLTTEYNLVHLVNRLINNGTDGDGFVISSEYNANSVFEFNIHGYYFSISNGSYITAITTASWSNIYAEIVLTEPGNIGFQELTPLDPQASGAYPLDSDGKFVGLEFSSTATSGRLSLHILERVGGGWRVPEESKVKFILRSPMGEKVTLEIDDGEL